MDKTQVLLYVSVVAAGGQCHSPSERDISGRFVQSI
jgi:hypothetical protein